jgi:hypothetical protein
MKRVQYFFDDSKTMGPLLKAVIVASVIAVIVLTIYLVWRSKSGYTPTGVDRLMKAVMEASNSPGTPAPGSPVRQRPVVSAASPPPQTGFEYPDYHYTMSPGQ